MSKFTQTIPIQSCLIAIAAGALVSRKIGPQSYVWSVAQFVEKAAWIFICLKQCFRLLRICVVLMCGVFMISWCFHHLSHLEGA